MARTFQRRILNYLAVITSVVIIGYLLLITNPERVKVVINVVRQINPVQASNSDNHQINVGHEINSDKEITVVRQRKVGRHQIPTNYIQRNYTIISAHVPNYGSDLNYIDYDATARRLGGRAWGYVFMTPLTAVTWKLIGFNTIVVLTLDRKNFHPSAQRILTYVERKLRQVGATVVYVDTPSKMKVRLSQLLRLIPGDLDMIYDNDFVVTSDADLWPIDQNRYIHKTGKSVLITNPKCCSYFDHGGKRNYQKYTLSSISMSGKLWREIFGYQVTSDQVTDNNYAFEDFAPFVNRVETFMNSKDLYNDQRNGRHWNVDKLFASVVIGDYFREHDKKIVQAEDKYECRRIETNFKQWGRTEAQLNEMGHYKCISEVHVVFNDNSKLFPWNEDVWAKTRSIAVRFFDKKTIKFMDDYVNTFSTGYWNFKYQFPTED